MTTIRIWSRRSCILEGVSNERHLQVWNEREIKFKIHRTIRNFGESRRCGLSASVTPKASKSPWYLSCINAEKIPADSTHVLDFETIKVNEKVRYVEEPVRILDKKEQVLQNKAISPVKVLWKHHGIEEATWESEWDMRERYPRLFEEWSRLEISRSKFLKRRRIVTSLKFDSPNWSLGPGNRRTIIIEGIV